MTKQEYLDNKKLIKSIQDIQKQCMKIAVVNNKCTEALDNLNMYIETMNFFNDQKDQERFDQERVKAGDFCRKMIDDGFKF